MKGLFCTILLVVMSQWSIAQHSISGRIIDEGEAPIEFVNILLYSAESLEMVTGEVTSEDGNFNFSNIPDGSYFIECSFIGFESVKKDITVYQNVELQAIILPPSKHSLDEVAITAKKPIFEKKSDRTVINVQNAITSAGNNALQILERAPGIQVDRINNAISMMGKNGVIVTINGKRSRLTQEALIQMLASTASVNIKSIELITNPPASYDAQGNGGIINIIMIKNENDGFNGLANFFAGMSKKPKYGGGINFNFNKGIINWYGDFSTNNDFADQPATLRQKIQYPNQLIDTYQENDRPNYTGNHSAKFGFDLQFDKEVEYGFFISGSKRIWKLDGKSTTEYLTAINAITTDILLSKETNQTDHFMISNHVAFPLSNNGKLSFDYDYLDYQITNPTDYTIQQLNENDTEIYMNNFSSSKVTPFDFHVFKGDYKGKIFESLNLKVGTKATLSNVSNDTRLTYLSPNPKDDPFFTDKIQMNENILAGYISLDGPLTKSTSFTSGLRYEQYNVDLESSPSGPLLSRNRGRWYPSTSIIHKFDDIKSISIYYNERVNRPGFQVLAPSFYFLDAHTVLGGNVQALPTITRTIGTDINFGQFFLSFAYSDEDDPISWGQPGINEDSNILILKPQNAPDRDIFAMNFSFPIQLTSFWTTQWNTNLFYRKETAYLEGSIIDNKGMAASGSINQNFKLPRSWEGELTTTWNSVFQVGLATFRPRISTNIGIQKTFSSGSKLSFNWNDIFDMGSFFSLLTDRTSSGIYYDWNYELEGNVFRVNFSFPFGNTGLKIREKHTPGSQIEQQRAQN